MDYRSRKLTTHDWHTLGSFGLLVVALGLFNPKAAIYTVAVAGAVVVVKNSGFVSGLLEGGKAT